MDAIIDMVEKMVEQKNDISITWYGGEPLIGKHIIYSLSEKFIKICNKYSVNYGAYMVSNGFLVTEEVIEQLKKYKVTGVQLTIDGPPEIHNIRRLKGTVNGTVRRYFS